MKYNLEISKSITRKIARKAKKGSELFSKTLEALSQLQDDPFYPSLNTHPAHVVSYNNKAYSSWANGEYRIIWIWSEQRPDTIFLIDFGTHKEVYR